MDEPFFELVLEDKVYSQRTKVSKILEFTLNGKRLKTYDELPDNLKEIINKVNIVEDDPTKYFNYIHKNGVISITGLKKDIGPYIKIPSEINGIPVIKCDFSQDSHIKKAKYIFLPNSITELNEKCFAYCESLKYVRLPEKLEVIPESCFEDCKMLKQIDLSNIKSINKSAFHSCLLLKKANLENIKKIEDYAFSHCGSLKNVNLGNELTAISHQVFNSCKSLVQINLPENLIFLGIGAFSDCTQLQTINFNENLKSISMDCFFGCSKLKEFIAPQSLTEIGNYAFSHTGLEKIVLNKDIKEFGVCIFTKSNKIKEASLYSYQLTFIPSLVSDKRILLDEPKKDNEER